MYTYTILTRLCTYLNVSIACAVPLVPINRMPHINFSKVLTPHRVKPRTLGAFALARGKPSSHDGSDTTANKTQPHTAYVIDVSTNHHMWHVWVFHTYQSIYWMPSRWHKVSGFRVESDLCVCVCGGFWQDSHGNLRYKCFFFVMFQYIFICLIVWMDRGVWLSDEGKCD